MPVPVPTRHNHRASILSIVLIVCAVIVAVGSYFALLERDKVINAQTDSQIALQQELATARQKSADLADTLRKTQDRLAQAEKDLNTSYAPIDISGPVDFPIQRGMAHPRDTLKAFAAREGTTVAIVRALNPWLSSDETHLESRQMLWIPKHSAIPKTR